jgi:hypothetical protein
MVPARMGATTTPRATRWLLPAFLILFLIAITVGLAMRGWSFYLLSLEERTEHPEYRVLRPSGLIGNGYGWVAATLVVMNLSYLIRRRFGGARLGSMRIWLDLHVFTGTTAAVMVSFHSAFQLRTPIATMSAASLMLVVVTGIVGRFLYAFAPAAAARAARLRSAIDRVDAELPGTGVQIAHAIDALPPPRINADASLIRSLLAIPKWRRVARARRESVRLILPERRAQPAGARKAVRELETAAASEARTHGLSALMRSWRGLHRFFALFMLAAVLLHAGVAWYYGYRWIFE